ncbi:MAG TPA: DUF1552 domain-containing protein [Patescibacteria group bacterium]|nr:DUF1552 domain-containing protein [Patescibacteria group bacterium]
MSSKSATQTARERFAAFNRRQFLRGLGACVALPALESLLPTRALAAGTDASARLATTAGGAPMRFGVVYFPNGAIQPSWWPKGEKSEFELAATMEPLQGVKNQIQVLGGMDQVNALPGPDGAGDHARASGTFLTGVRVKKTAGADIHAGISIDQVIAAKVGHLTRFPSLELTCDAVRKSGNCDSGYSCAYQYNLSWRSPTTPIAPEPNPRLLFERLFGSGTHGERIESLKRRQQEQRSILDFVLDEAHSLEKQLTYRDKQKLDEYLVSVREIEQRIQKAERFGKPVDPTMPTPDGIPNGFEDYVQIMFDMMVVAFQTDSTRIATFLLANEGSNRPFPEIGIAEGHHSLTHHMNKQDMIDKVAQIDLWYMKQFARFLQKMEQTRDIDGRSLLNNSMIIYGSGNADGNRHTHTNLPVILAGAGGGQLRPGRFAQFGSVPMSNMLLGLASRMGVCDVQRLGDSTGKLDAI